MDKTNSEPDISALVQMVDDGFVAAIEANYCATHTDTWRHEYNSNDIAAGRSAFRALLTHLQAVEAENRQLRTFAKSVMDKAALNPPKYKGVEGGFALWDLGLKARDLLAELAKGGEK